MPRAVTRVRRWPGAVAVTMVPPVLLLLAMPQAYRMPPGSTESSERLPAVEEVGQAAWIHARMLAEEIGPRPSGSSAEAEGFVYAEQVLRSLGYRVYRQPVGVFDLAEAAGHDGLPDRFVLAGANLIAVKPGREPAVVLAAHMDTVDRLCPGANDNASGVASVLEAARLLADRPMRHEIRLALFTGEEHGLVGAMVAAHQARPGQIGVVINADPVGFGTLVAAPMPTTAPHWFQRAAHQEARRLGLERFRVVPSWVLIPRVLSLPFGADHQPFMHLGIPAWSLSNRMQRWSYHTERDDVGVLQARTLGEATLLLTALALRFDERMPPPEAAGHDPRYGVLVLPWGTVLPAGLALYILLVLCLGLVGMVFWMGGSRILPGLKVWMRSLALALGFGIGAGLPSLLQRLLTGYIHPWMGQLGPVVAAGLAAGLAALWVVARLLPAIRAKEGNPCLAGAALLWGAIAVVLAGIVGPDAALPFAWGGGAAAVALLMVRAFPNPAGAGIALLLLVVGSWPLAATFETATLREAITLMGLAPPPYQMVLLRALLVWPLLLALQGIWPPLAKSVGPAGTLPRRAGGARPPPAWVRLLTHPRTGAALVVGAAILTVVQLRLPAYHADFRQVVDLQVVLDQQGRPRQARAWSWDRLKGLESAWEGHVSASGRIWELEPPAGIEPAPIRMSVVLDTLEVTVDRTVGRLRVEARLPLAAESLWVTLTASDSMNVAGATIGHAGEPSRWEVRDITAREHVAWEAPVILPAGVRLQVTVNLNAAGDHAGVRLGPSSRRRDQVVVAATTRAWGSFLFGPAPAGG